MMCIMCMHTGLNMHRAVISLILVGMLMTLQLFQVSSLPPDFFRVGCIFKIFTVTVIVSK